MLQIGDFTHHAAGLPDESHRWLRYWRNPQFPTAKRAEATQEERPVPRPVPVPDAWQSQSVDKLQALPNICSPGSFHLPVARTRPKHIPIVIPNYVPIVVLDSLPYSAKFSLHDSFNSALSGSSSSSDRRFSQPKRSTDSGSRKPRHVRIRIPDWAQPVQTLPNTPTSPTSNRSSVGVSVPPRTSPPASPTMARQTPNTSRANTMDSTTSAPSPAQLYSNQSRSGSNAYLSSMNASQTSLHRLNTQESSNGDQDPGSARTPASGTQSAGPSPAVFQTAGLNASSTSTGLSGLVCNVHRTTGREPHPLVGASTTIVGDKLYVFGGRRLSRTRPQLTNDMYELDLIRRHWTKLETTGSIPPPRYFHSVCALGDRTLVCYGGMSPAQGSGVPYNPQDPQPEVVVMSDIHLFDVPTAAWMKINVDEAPQGRYAHCAAILPSSAAFTSPNAPLSAINHNPASQNPNQGTIGVSVDGAGGAEMIVVGGQDSANHYIEQISVFNLRSLKWTETSPLGRSCGAYRSVVAPLVSMDASKIGAGHRRTEGEEDQSDVPPAASMLIYSNYNFLDVKLELQVRHPDGSLTEKPMHGNFSPPGLRFPNGGIIANHFVVSGTFLTSSKQEYALWALDLRTLTWSRIDAGGTIFTQGSWNRGVLWNRRNTFVILGNRKRSLVDDYNHRRINFSNVCMVELEAYGLYDNPRKLSPTSAYLSTSSPAQVDLLDLTAGGRTLSPAAHELGAMALGIRELADMDFMCMGGERIPVNSRLIARRWGPYFNQLLQNDIATQDGTDTATLHPGTIGHPSRNSSITITPSIKTTITAYSNATTLTNNNNNNNSSSSSNTADTPSPYEPPSPARANPSTRPRTLYLPHTHLTVQALIHYLYTSALPATHSPLCTPQILCSLLQIARPYRIDGLLEALVERLHTVLDGRNTAAIFNAAAMAAGAGDGISFNPQSLGVPGTPALVSQTHDVPTDASVVVGLQGLRINTNVGANGHPNGAALEEEASSATSATSRDEEWSAASVSVLGEREVWMGELSAVVGLQKRGLRGLMEGRRIRERGQRPEGGGGGGEGQGLGIA